MKNNEQQIDQLIKESLSENEAKFYDELDEQNLIQMLGGLYKTKNRWFILLMNLVSLIVFGLLIYCTVQFFNTQNTNELIIWMAGGFVCLTFISMIKLFVWMQMDKNALLREIKRLELVVASGADKKQ